MRHYKKGAISHISGNVPMIGAAVVGVMVERATNEGRGAGGQGRPSIGSWLSHGVGLVGAECVVVMLPAIRHGRFGRG
ncbi:MAG: hypothetical protein ABI876_02285 [Bacteroidota bacterium]